MEKVFIAGAIPEVGLNLLKEHFEVEMYDDEGLISKDALINGVKDATALVSLLSTNADKDVIDSAKNLKIIANYGAGFNNVDIDYAREKDIDVTNTPKASTNATADLTIGLILSVARRIVEGDELSRTKGFAGWAPLFFRGREVSEKTIGIIGLGEIGGAVAKRARAFDMDVLYTGPHRKEEKERDIGAKYVDLDTLLENADFITINAAYNPDLHHLIDTEQFKKMKSTAYIVNAGRGPIINEQALVKALQDKEIEGAALDVYEFEPKITDELKSLKNVVLTPHIGNATFEARDMMAKIVANDTIKKLNGKTPQFIVNPQQ
ncbi:hydroxyacid dehydrogenase [Staphylococcus warneri]|uniref:NAD(P)-dependent oxidoreductase n=1 Tax=Staphylococcus warneri TaxID=1292 RepID=UPI00203F4BFA|nr:NAD(P)-dependent oxidoreductase [Staphylococcus warneri]MCM3319520.1 hydroxyacid dehydrogenase [Staphylococcus warneri]